MPLYTTCHSEAIVYNVGIALNNLYSNKRQLFCTHAWSPGGKRGGILYKPLTLQTLQRWIATGNGNLEGTGLYALLISRQEEITGLVKPLLPKPTMKPRITHITVIPLVTLRITCVYSINAIIVLLEVSCYTGSTGCIYCKMD